MAEISGGYKFINNRAEAIECIKANKPTSGYYMFQESLNMAISDMEKLDKIEIVLENRGGYALEIFNAIKRIEQIVKGEE